MRIDIPIETESFEGLFYDNGKNFSFDFSHLNTSNVTNMLGIFNGCTSLTSLDLSNFDTSNVISMSNMFSNCNSLISLDLSNFDASNVIQMIDVFGCYKLNYIKCKQSFKDWCIENQDVIELPNQMREGGSGVWDIVE